MNSRLANMHRRLAIALCAALLAAVGITAVVQADEPYARSRDYDLQNVRTHLSFDTDRCSVHGEVTHSLALLRDNVTELKFDSVDLKIADVKLDGQPVKFSVTATDVVVPLDRPGKRGDKHEVYIKYDGTPKKGLYFILPDKDYPNRPKEIWSQGESEDTRYYIPIYDYPNDRTTSEMLLTVPASWITISNGKLAGIKTEPDGMKTWDWKETQPLSTYLISVVAGEFQEKNDEWRGMPVRYVVPRGEEDKIEPTFERTKQMLDLFSDKLGVRYPWAQYAQSSVDDFVEGGMENASATTLTARGLVNPQLAPEERAKSDDLNSHELAHQWFGDLVTCKDWSNIWLNEGFATYFEHYWLEQHYGADDATYAFWQDQRQWFASKRLYTSPIVNYKAEDELAYAGNIYTKGGWVLHMLREKLGDEDFFRGLNNYLTANRGKNVVTADLQKAIEQSTATNVDLFFNQWVFGAGAPEFTVSYAYDDAAHQLKLAVAQTQKVEGAVGLFDVPVEIEISTASGRKSYPIEVSKESETFTLPSDAAPQMVLFDKGGKILKQITFAKDPAAWIYQLKNAEAVADRLDAARALGDVKDNPGVVAALGAAAQSDPFWGLRNEALRSLGEIGAPAAQQQVEAALSNDQPWVRATAVDQLGRFKDSAVLGPKLTDLAANDKAWTVRAAALRSLGKIKAPNAYDTLSAGIKTDSPNDVLRIASLRGMGDLGDDRAVPLLLEWSAIGKPFTSRLAAIGAVAELDKKNPAITATLVSYLREPYFDVQFYTMAALGRRGDPSAIAPLEALVKSGNLSLGTAPMIQREIDSLKEKSGAKPAAEGVNNQTQASEETHEREVVLDNLKKLQQQLDDVAQRLTKIEKQLSAAGK